MVLAQECGMMRPNQQTTGDPRTTAPVTRAFRSLGPMRRIPLHCAPQIVHHVAVTPLPDRPCVLVASVVVLEIRLKARR